MFTLLKRIVLERVVNGIKITDMFRNLVGEDCVREGCEWNVKTTNMFRYLVGEDAEQVIFGRGSCVCTRSEQLPSSLDDRYV